MVPGGFAPPPKHPPSQQQPPHSESNSHQNVPGGYHLNDRVSPRQPSMNHGGHKFKNDSSDPQVVLSTKTLIDAIITKTIKHPVDKSDSYKSRSASSSASSGPRPPPETIDITTDTSKPEEFKKATNNFVASSSSSSLPPASKPPVSNHLPGRGFTLGEGINAIINQEYMSEGRGNPSLLGGLPPPVSSSSKTGQEHANELNECGDRKNSPIHHNWKQKALKRPTDHRTLPHDGGQPPLVDLVDPPAAKVMRRHSPSASASGKDGPSGHYESISPPPMKGLNAVPSSAPTHPHNPSSTAAPSGYSFATSSVIPHVSKPAENG